jgi:hypothetical protein
MDNCAHPTQMETKYAWQQHSISCWPHFSVAQHYMNSQQHPAPPCRPPHSVHDTACARAPLAPAALRLPPPLRLGRRPRPAAPPLCAGLPRENKSAHARPLPPAAGPSNDLYRFSPAANNWTKLSISGSGPSLRGSMGFAATPDGMLYVFGGAGDGDAGGVALAVGFYGGQLRCMGAVCVGLHHAACTCRTAAVSLSCRGNEGGTGGDM